MGAIEKFGEIYKNRHDYVKDWKKRTGGKAVGYFCTYAPEELMYAAGILPTRVLGSHKANDIVEPHIYGMFCPLSRDILAQGLEGKYDYLDGIMIGQSCLHMRQAFESWRLHVPVDYSYYLYMPHGIQSPRAKPYLRAELAEFKKSLEKWIGKEITDEDIDKAIDVYNTNRQLLKQVYEFRKQEEPPITGEEAMKMVVAVQSIDKAEANKLLEEALKELPDRKLDREVGTRLITIGSENDDVEFLNMIEQQCDPVGTVVIEDHCTGSRYFWDEVVPDKDRLQAIANRYVDRVPCPSKDWPDHWRFNHIQRLLKDFDVEGAILIQQKFCDPHEIDMPALRKLLDDNGITYYFLELDLTVPVGQFRTRVEAYLETLELEIV